MCGSTEPDLQQATKRPQEAEEQNSPLAALVDPAKLERDYVVTEAGTSAGLEWLQLTPRKDEEGGFRSARLGFGRRPAEDDRGGCAWASCAGSRSAAGSAARASARHVPLHPWQERGRGRRG